jgi:long-chain acyl-CoA synthetase
VALDFWALNQGREATAVVTEDGSLLAYGDLAGGSDRFAECIDSSEKTLGFILCRNTSPCLMAYLGALRSGNAACLLDAGLEPGLLGRLIDRYSPDWIFALGGLEIPAYHQNEIKGGFLHFRVEESSESKIHPDLALLLPTSGSTGSPKLVRLSYRNLQANAVSIREYLCISPVERGITSLPMAYSYGLSVINSHLLAGARLLLTSAGFLQREFWNFFEIHGATSLAGVPYHYETMLRMRLLEKALPSLRTLTQAGGRLSPECISRVAKLCAERGRNFFVMYGQTEATARIAYVPAEKLQEKPGSIGIAIQEGKLFLDPETSELLYEGPNVMLGYAERRADLSKGDEMNCFLRTGDLAMCDEDGFYYITGRLKRFLKLFGRRFSLDEMEEVIARYVGCGVACCGKDDHVVVAIDSSLGQKGTAKVMTDILKLHPSAFRVVTLNSLPRLPNGKQDYQALLSLGGV